MKLMKFNLKKIRRKCWWIKWIIIQWIFSNIMQDIMWWTLWSAQDAQQHRWLLKQKRNFDEWMLKGKRQEVAVIRISYTRSEIRIKGSPGPPPPPSAIIGSPKKKILIMISTWFFFFFLNSESFSWLLITWTYKK